MAINSIIVFHFNYMQLISAFRTLTLVHGVKLNVGYTVWVHRISSKYNTCQNVLAPQCSDNFPIEQTAQSRSVIKASPKTEADVFVWEVRHHPKQIQYTAP